MSRPTDTICLCVVLLILCACSGPSSEVQAERSRKAEAVRLENKLRQEQWSLKQVCWRNSIQEQVAVLKDAGFNVRYRQAGIESEWSPGPAPSIPAKARHFIKKVEKTSSLMKSLTIWSTAQVYINPTGFYLANRTETSKRGRVKFQIYMFHPAAHKGYWGNQTRFAKRPFPISSKDIFRPPGKGDYIVAVMPVSANLPKRLWKIPDRCNDLPPKT